MQVMSQSVGLQPCVGDRTRANNDFIQLRQRVLAKAIPIEHEEGRGKRNIIALVQQTSVYL